MNGIVQGVGFRPFVARLARRLELTGWVLNNTAGVEIHVEGEHERLEAFVQSLRSEAPAAAVILSLESESCTEENCDAFVIRKSEQAESLNTLVSPDLATCPDCLGELFDPDDRRYHYPFINCTNCGPRFTIINELPYDRPVTSMAPFAMCPDCADEYADDADRRYHAQPDACFDCGPLLWLATAEEAAQGVPSMQRAADAEQARALSDALVERASSMLKSGSILAVKGLGGWHLSCDATNAHAVEMLRQRKRRPTKPLAIMVATLDAAQALCEVSDEEATLLESPAHPIVLMRRAPGCNLAQNVAGELPEVGLMLPSTPLQHLLCRAAGTPLVMTSGNRSGEPIVAGDEEAFDALGAIADAFLGNNRAIVARYDDSVARVLSDGPTQMVRRARGFAPTPLLLHNAAGASMPCIFAAGPEQKATFCLLDGERAYISQHLGDLETVGAWSAWTEAKERYQRLFGLKPAALACDMHPEYLSSKWARSFAKEHGLPLVEVQHHHAHIASVLGENQLDEKVIGVAIDGTGYGTDGTIWGCEVLIAQRANFERFWHLPTFALPGGAAAVKDPRRTAVGLLQARNLLNDPRFTEFLEGFEESKLMLQMIEKNLNAPLCSSAGRLFDATAALLGLCEKAGYDGEPACLLEAQAQQELLSGHIFAPLKAGQPLTACGVHASLVATLVEQCVAARELSGIRKVALSGGCMVNRLLSSQLTLQLEAKGFEVYTNKQLPPNDGCISYGQAVVAQAQLCR